MRIKTRLAFLFLICTALPFIIFWAALYARARDAVSHEVLRTLENSATNLEWRIELVIEHYLESFSQLKSLSQLNRSLAEYSGRLDSPARKTIADILRDTANSARTIKSAAVYDKFGAFISGFPEGAPTETFPYASRIAEGTENDPLVLIDRAPDGSAKMEIASALTANPGEKSERIGYLLVQPDLLPLKRLSARPLGVGQTEDLELVASNAAGETVFVLPPRFSSGESADQLRKAQSTFGLTDGRQVFDDVPDYRGEPVLAVTRRIAPVNWLMAVKVDQHEVFAPLVSLRHVAAGVGILLVILVIAASQWVAADLSHPIFALNEMAERLKSGRMDSRVGLTGPVEIVELGGAFNRMADELQSSEKRLQQQLGTLREQEARTRASQEQNFLLSSVLRNSVDAIIGHDLENIIRVWNDGAARLFGWTAEEAIGKPISMLQPSSGQDEERHIAETLAAGERIQNLETQRRRKDGTLIDVSLSISQIRDVDGRFVGVAKIARDIRERKQAEDFMKAALREKELLLKEIHHRVKNNMQVISSLLKLQSEYLDDQEARQLFKQSDERVRSMALIHERLYRAKTLAEIDLAEYIEELVARLLRSYTINPDRITVKTDLVPVLLGIDQAIPCGLLLNECISNSLKHAFGADQTGTLTITLRESDDTVTLTVRDDGRGFPPELDFQHPTSLGLEIIRTLTDQLEGILTMEKGTGTSFVLRFKHKIGTYGRRTGNGIGKHISV